MRSITCGAEDGMETGTTTISVVSAGTGVLGG